MKRKSGDQVRLREHLQQKLRTTHFFDCFKSFYNLINFLCPLRKLLSRVTCWNELISEVSWVINLSVPMVGFNWEAFSRWKNMKCHLFPVPSCLEWLLQTLDRTPKVVSPSYWAMDLEGEYSRLDHVTNRNNIYFLFSDKIKKLGHLLVYLNFNSFWYRSQWRPVYTTSTSKAEHVQGALTCRVFYPFFWNNQWCHSPWHLNFLSRTFHQCCDSGLAGMKI